MKKSITAVAMMLALAGAGCGGDDKDSDSSSGGALSKEEFSQRANEICKATNAKVESLSEQFTGTAETDAPLFDTALPAIQSGVAEFGKLKPPSELQAPFDEFIALSKQQVAATATAQGAAQTGDDEVYQEALTELQGIGEQNDAAAKKLGATECAK